MAACLLFVFFCFFQGYIKTKESYRRDSANDSTISYGRDRISVVAEEDGGDSGNSGIRMRSVCRFQKGSINCALIKGVNCALIEDVNVLLIMP